MSNYWELWGKVEPSPEQDKASCSVLRREYTSLAGLSGKVTFPRLASWFGELSEETAQRIVYHMLAARRHYRREKQAFLNTHRSKKTKET